MALTDAVNKLLEQGGVRTPHEIYLVLLEEVSYGAVRYSAMHVRCCHVGLLPGSNPRAEVAPPPLQSCAACAFLVEGFGIALHAHVHGHTCTAM